MRQSEQFLQLPIDVFKDILKSEIIVCKEDGQFLLNVEQEKVILKSVLFYCEGNQLEDSPELIGLLQLVSCTCIFHLVQTSIIVI